MREDFFVGWQPRQEHPAGNNILHEAERSKQALSYLGRLFTIIYRLSNELFRGHSTGCSSLGTDVFVFELLLFLFRVIMQRKRLLLTEYTYLNPTPTKLSYRGHTTIS